MESIQLKVKSLAFASAAVWGSGVFIVGVLNMISPGYGQAFLEVVSSVYPGYKADASIFSVVIGTLYAVLDGAIGGAVLAWLYNR